MIPIRDPGSFRDPSGYVFIDEDCVWRSVNPAAEALSRAILASGAIDHLMDRGGLIPTEIRPLVEAEKERFRGARGEVPNLVMKHPRIPFISYPYEWTFSQLKDAALAHLDLQLFALERGVVLSDATPFNMQFLSDRIVHIDVLSLQPYVEGQPWAGYNQFCRLFLLPLLMEAWLGVAFQPLLRGRIDGIDLAEAARILPWWRLWLDLNGLMHVALHARTMGRRFRSAGHSTSPPPTLPKHRYQAILTGLRDWIAKLTSGRPRSHLWGDYAARNTYSDAMREAKKAFVGTFVGRLRAPIVWDIGGNSGDYSVVALEAGAKRAILFDSDLDALELAYARRREQKLDLLPIVMDTADPSPSMGWNQVERRGLNQRKSADMVLGLAVIHHMAIGRNVPLQAIVDWFVEAAPSGIIEFVPKTDPMVREMLALRKDVFHDYDEQAVRAYLGRNARITGEHRFPENDRLLIGYARDHG